MKEIIEELKKRGFVDTLQKATNVMSSIGTSEGEKINEEAQFEAGKYALTKYICTLDEDDDLLNKCFDVSLDMLAGEIIKELDLKPEEGYELKGIDKLAMLLGLMKTIVKEDK